MRECLPYLLIAGGILLLGWIIGGPLGLAIAMVAAGILFYPI